MMRNTLTMGRHPSRALRRTLVRIGVGLAVCGLLASAGCGRYGSPIRTAGPGGPGRPEAMGGNAAAPADRGGIEAGATAPVDPECEEEEE